jgi:hypothetical protein
MVQRDCYLTYSLNLNFEVWILKFYFSEVRSDTLAVIC